MLKLISVDTRLYVCLVQALKFLLSFSSAEAPEFATSTTSFSIADSTPLGTSVAEVSFTDRDQSDTLTLSMSGAQSAYFELTDRGDKTGIGLKRIIKLYILKITTFHLFSSLSLSCLVRRCLQVFCGPTVLLYKHAHTRTHTHVHTRTHTHHISVVVLYWIQISVLYRNARISKSCFGKRCPSPIIV